MNEPKFTPGPWSIHGTNIEGKLLIGPVGKENNTGKIVVIDWNCCGKDSDEWKANAKLIAAAPELIKVLDELNKAAIALADYASPEYKNERNDLFADVHNAHLHAKEILKKVTE